MIPITQKMRDETKADLEFGRLMPDEIKKTALPQAYKDALQAFKDQAKSVTSQIRDGKSNIKANKIELKAAQARMASHAAETKVIYRLLSSKDKTLTIDTLDEQRLAQELGVDYIDTTMTLFEKLGRGTVNRIDTLLREKQIVAVNHQHNGTCLVLKDGSRLILEGLLQDDSKKLVGYLGFYGHGPNGLDTPAFAIRPNGYPDRG